MAGDWIKMEASTPDKAEVLEITALMGWDDADMTVGKLFRVWRWFDQQTIDGNAPRVTSALLDRVVGVTGFCEAMQKVGWLNITDGGISLPKFDRHNGKTAKSRALTAKRVAAFKGGNAKGNGDSVSRALPREEKRREDSKHHAASDDACFGFDEFWSAYPRKTAKANALKAWRKIKADHDLLQSILDSVRIQSESPAWKKDGGQFVPHPATWLNGRRWEDETESCSASCGSIFDGVDN